MSRNTRLRNTMISMCEVFVGGPRSYGATVMTTIREYYAALDEEEE